MNTIPTVRSKITPKWELAIAMSDCSDMLDWEHDSACGEECLRIMQLADYVITQWLDVERDIVATAVHQMCVICNG